MTAAANLVTACGPRIEFAGIDLTLGRTRMLEQVSFNVAAGSVLYVTTSHGPCRVKVPNLPKVVASGARPKPAPQQCIPEVAP